MTISSYSDLQTAVGDWLARGDITTARIQDFIRLAEARFSRILRTRQMITRETASLTTEYTALPTGFLQMAGFHLLLAEKYRLEYMTPEQMDATWAGSYTGQPRYYCIVGTEVRVAPTPDTSYAAEMTVYTFTPLSDTATTNWLLTSHPDAYLFGALSEAAPYIGDDDRLALWQGRLKEIIETLSGSDQRGRYSGSGLQARPPFKGP
jgi:hypothetical protein